MKQLVVLGAGESGIGTALLAIEKGLMYLFLIMEISKVNTRMFL